MRTTRRPSSAIQEQLITALLPDVHATAPVTSAAPLPTLPTPAPPRGPLVGATRLDQSGRLREHRLFRALGWDPGHRLDLDVAHGVILARPAPAGTQVLDGRGALHLPVAARRMCGITAGATVVLAASPPEHTLLIYPEQTVARLLTDHHRDLPGGSA